MSLLPSQKHYDKIAATVGVIKLFQKRNRKNSISICSARNSLFRDKTPYQEQALLA